MRVAVLDLMSLKEVNAKLLKYLIEFLENPILILGSTLQSRTICSISIKNRQNFPEKKSKVSAQHAPLSH
jgi:hypothetical protein